MKTLIKLSEEEVTFGTMGQNCEWFSIGYVGTHKYVPTRLVTLLCLVKFYLVLGSTANIGVF